MSLADELSWRPATELARLIRSKAISPVEVLRSCLETIERLNPKINAICTLAAESAMAAAERAERAVMAGDEIGLLHGVPIGIKDLTPTAGIRTTFGSPLFANNVPSEDAAVVKRIKHAGAIVVGKTNTPEFGAGANTVNRVFGATRNPWDLALSVGGSSGGGAAALASGMLPLAEGTDFGGSLRVPAAFCGVVGLRPTAGLVPRYPTPLPWDVGTVHGPMARNAEDAALLLEAMMGDDDGLTPISATPPWKSVATAVAQSRDLKKLRIGYASDIAGLGIDPEISTACRTAAMRLADYGATVDELEFSVADELEAYLVLRGLTMVARFFKSLGELENFGPNLKGNIEAGSKLTTGDIAQRRAQACRAVASLAHTVRADRFIAHTDNTSATISSRTKLSRHDRRPKDDQLHRLDCADFFSDAEQSSGRLGAVWADHCRASDWTSDHWAALCRAEDSCCCKTRARDESNWLAATC